MGQINAKLRSVIDHHFSHWCPGCEEMHAIPKSWTFDGNLDAPTISPSVKITGKQRVNVNGVWTGEWVRDENGKAKDHCCHYVMTAGILNYCNDSTHKFKGQPIPLPDLPDFMRDPLKNNLTP